MSEFSPGNAERFVTAVSEAAVLLRRIAEPRPVGDKVKAAINRAAARVSLPTRRVEDLWYGEARLVRAEEMDAIRRAAQARQDQEANAREHAADLGTLFAGIAERLRAIDPDFHRHQAAALLDAAGALGASHRPVDCTDEG